VFLFTGIIYLKPTKYSLKLRIHKDPKNNLSCHTFRENQANCNYLYIKSEQKKNNSFEHFTKIWALRLPGKLRCSPPTKANKYSLVSNPIVTFKTIRIFLCLSKVFKTIYITIFIRTLTLRFQQWRYINTLWVETVL